MIDVDSFCSLASVVKLAKIFLNHYCVNVASTHLEGNLEPPLQGFFLSTIPSILNLFIMYEIVNSLIHFVSATNKMKSFAVGMIL